MLWWYLEICDWPEGSMEAKLMCYYTFHRQFPTLHTTLTFSSMHTTHSATGILCPLPHSSISSAGGAEGSALHSAPGVCSLSCTLFAAAARSSKYSLIACRTALRISDCVTPACKSNANLHNLNYLKSNRILTPFFRHHALKSCPTKHVTSKNAIKQKNHSHYLLLFQHKFSHPITCA